MEIFMHSKLKTLRQPDLKGACTASPPFHFQLPQLDPKITAPRSQGYVEELGGLFSSVIFSQTPSGLAKTQRDGALSSSPEDQHEQSSQSLLLDLKGCGGCFIKTLLCTEQWLKYGKSTTRSRSQPKNFSGSSSWNFQRDSESLDSQLTAVYSQCCCYSNRDAQARTQEWDRTPVQQLHLLSPHQGFQDTPRSPEPPQVAESNTQSQQ